MKLSIEAKVGVAVASSFVALTMCVMAQGRSGGGTGGPHGYGPMNNPGLSHMSAQGLQSSEFGRTTAEENRMKFFGDTDETTVITKAKKKKTFRSTKHRLGHVRVND